MKKEVMAIAGLLIAVFVLLFGNNIYQQFTGHSIFATPISTTTTSPDACVVPELTNLDQGAAENAITQLGLQPVRSTQYNSEVKAGIVTGQEPPSGTMLKPCKGEIIITISLGPTPSPTLTPDTPAANIAPEGRVQVSSVYDECYSGNKAVDGVIAGYPESLCTEWGSRGEGPGATLRLVFTRPRRITDIILYDRPNNLDHVLEATLTFSDGTTIKTGSLANDGTAKMIGFDPKTVEWIEFRVNESDGPNIGLAEIEVYGW